jgi:hypothetical protein
MTMEASVDARPPATPVNSLLAAPILPTLLKLALPNAIAMLGTALVAVAETSYIGRLGVEPLAGIALVFPFVMLTQMMSAGAMGGGVSSAVARALGAGNRERAANLAAAAATCSNRRCTIRKCCSPAQSRSGSSTRWRLSCAAPATCACPRSC